MVRRCHACKKERRYPVEAKRTKRKTERGVEVTGGEAAGGDAMEVGAPAGAGRKVKGQKQKQKQPQGQQEG